jgi:phosphoglycolate phosphatase-like HAD superfamily hydrolase
MPKLVLWDIDHTLIAMRGVGGELFGRAFHHTTGVPMKRQAAVDGMTDPVIFRETARLHGLTTSRADFEAFAAALADLHLSHVPEIRERGHALPGGAKALAALAAVPGTRQTVVTGNIKGSARVKLAAFGLDTPIVWELGAYGEDSDTRPGLVATALHRAQAHDGTAPPLNAFVLIGDTPADMAGASAHGLHAIGIASGRSTQGELRAAGAGATLPDLQDTAALLRVIEARID